MALILDNILSANTLLCHSTSVCEILTVAVDEPKLLITVIYRPPNSSPQNFKIILDKLNQIISSETYSAYTSSIFGDFNFPFIEWLPTQNNYATYRNKHNGLISEANQFTALNDLMSKNFYSQYISQPTRSPGDNTLDLIFINDNNLINDILITPTSFSDHHMIRLTTNINLVDDPTRETNPNPTIPLKTFNFHSEKTNWDNINVYLSDQNWDTTFHNMAIETMVKVLLEKCAEACTNNVPARCTISKNKIPRDRRILFRNRKKTQKKLETCTNENRKQTLVNKIIDIENALLQSRDDERDMKEKRAVENIKKNKKYFYKFARNQSKIKSKIGPLKVNGETISDPSKIAEALKNQYETVFTTPRTNPDPPNHPPTLNVPHPSNPAPAIPDTQNPEPENLASLNPDHETPNPLTDLEITDQMISVAIRDLKPNSAAGPDGLAPIFLQKCEKSFIHPLKYIYTNSISTGSVPDIFKIGIITPIHKGGNRSEPKNYRPITLTSILCKVLEKIILKPIVIHLRDNLLYNERQHGFRAKRSTLSQLLCHIDELLDNMEKGYNVDVVYLDFAKAFDKVDHGILLQKLKSLGIRGKFSNWIESFLTNRKQFIAANGALSTQSNVLSGVPQGTILGPILFLILIRDIDHNLKSSKAYSFADDTKIVSKIKTHQDVNNAQQDLNTIYAWEDENNMKFNPDKFQHISYSLIKNSEPRIYKNSSQTDIAPTNSVKDLGVTLSSDLSFQQHIQNTVGKCNNLISWILRTFRTRDSLPLLTLYKSLVIPHLDYCSQLWCPYKVQEIAQLEQVQRSFTSKISDTYNLSYLDRLKKLNLYSLERRRERYLILYSWKIIENLVDNPNNKFSTYNHIRFGRLINIPSWTSQTSSTKISNLKHNFFTKKGPRLFNLLPAEIRNISGSKTETFKYSLDRFLKHIPDHPNAGSVPNQREAANNSLESWLPIIKRKSPALWA